MQSQHYRPDIDGLRAIAVLAVLAFHLQIFPFRGGFTGVDVFFVISGYLITSILLREIGENRFSFSEFYRRRIKRLAPALIVVVFASSVAAATIFFTPDLKLFGRSAVSAILFVSNFHFWLTTDYFVDLKDNPLLHTWSLAIEEQFYLVFPLAVVLAFRFARNHILWIALASILLSFAVSIVTSLYFPEAGFYLLPSRLWELMIGATLAILGSRARLAPLFRSLGVVVILIGAVLIDGQQFPGWKALVPCLGAAMVIAADGRDKVYAMLASRPMVHIGAISYSLYLWHWPVIVFYTYTTGAALDGWDKAAIFAASLILAHLSWRFVENPVRFGAWGRRAAVPVAVCGGVLMVGIGIAFLSLGDFWRTYDVRTANYLSYMTYAQSGSYRQQYRAGTCFISSRTADAHDFSEDVCLKLDKQKPNYLLIGDSFAAHLWYGLNQAFDANILQATASGCKPTLRTTGSDYCMEIMQRILGHFVVEHRVDAVIISARWQEQHVEEISETVAYLKNHTDKVIVLGPSIEYQRSFPLLLARQDGTPLFLDKARKDQHSLSGSIQNAVESAGGIFISMEDVICPDGHCLLLTEGGKPVHFDYAHFTMEGSNQIGERLRERLVSDLGLVGQAEGEHQKARPTR